jgi:hypothetical protein
MIATKPMIMHRSWRHALLFERILELKHIPHIVDGECRYGGGVNVEIDLAVQALDENKLDECERWCIEAEKRSLRRYDPGFKPMSEFYITDRAPVDEYSLKFTPRAPTSVSSHPANFRSIPLGAVDTCFIADESVFWQDDK